ncbi:MAG TPA: serine/threonine-protein kinase [Kofleriaceae bacterium]|nr:serine/threonine-protein kinase [Kofleriaceae bacterium]
MLAPGTIVADKYRLERVLGRGGMGMVVEARHVQLGTLFALKFLYSSILANVSLMERFLREARATAALKSEHVCRVFDVGTFDGTPFIVMERLEGVDLAKLLRQAARVPLPEACDYVIQACAGVAEAHAAQIVHRDLKPGNLFVTERADGTPLIKILDFGIAKAPHDDNLELTGTYTILGSPSYMSLEQLRSSKLVDARSDIWSLGVILFELIAGRKPFVGETVADLAVKIALDSVPRLPDGPAALDDIIARCVAHDPAQRYQSVGELARALAPFADDPARRLAASIGRAGRGALSPSPLPPPSPPPSPIPPAPSRAQGDLLPTVPMQALSSPPEPPPAVPPPVPPPPSPPPQQLGAATGAHEPLVPSSPLPRLDGKEPSLGELVKPPQATTMQTAGAIENAAPVRGPYRRVRAIIATVGAIVGIGLGAVAAGEDEVEPAAPDATRLVEPAAATLPALPAAAPAPPPEAALTPPPVVPDAAVALPEEDSAIEMEPASEPRMEPEPAPAPASPPRRKPRMKSSIGDLGKSRI